MAKLQLKRTADGYQTNKVAIKQQGISPRQAQFAAYAIGHTLPYKEAGKEMGITQGSVQQLAKQLFFKLRVNNLLQATTELYKRGLIKHLCALLFIGLTAAPQADASDIYRRPTKQHRASRLARRSKRDDLLILVEPQ